METKVNKELIKNKLDHGDLTEISVITGLHRNTIYHYFNGRTKKFNRRITQAALEIIGTKHDLVKKFEQEVEKGRNL